jgi:hypothetical protein
MRTLPALLPVFLMLAVLTFLSSCKKDPYQVGLDLLPPSDTLHVLSTDTSTLFAYSLLQDSCRTDNASTIMLGSIMDPVFGSTTASIYAQFRMSSTEADFGTNPKFDSLVLVLAYSGAYGDTNTTQNIRVWELSQSLNYDSTYYSHRTVSTYPTLLANVDVTPRPHDSVTVYAEKSYPHMRINLNKLTNYLGNKLLYMPEDARTANETFLTFMKGLYIQSTPVYDKGALLSFGISAGYSKLVLYYHTVDTIANSFDMLINTSCSYFTHIDHRAYADADPDLKRQILQHDTTGSKSKLYLQGLGGVATRIRIPYIRDFNKDGHHIALNNALLILKNYETDTTLQPPPTLVLMKYDSTNTYGYIIDSDEGTAYYGGTYNKTERTYKFRITRYLQQVLLGNFKNEDLFLMVTNPSANVLYPYRIIINGTQTNLPQQPSDRLQLQLIYTRIN